MAELVTTQSIVERIAEILEDSSFVTWTREQIVDKLNDACLAIVHVKPESNRVVKNLDASVGATQGVPSDALMLLDVMRNMTRTVISQGQGQEPDVIQYGNSKAIRGPVARELLDAFDPNWSMDANAADEADEWIFDDRNPRRFELNPPLKAVIGLKIAYAASPAVMTVTVVYGGTAQGGGGSVPIEGGQTATYTYDPFPLDDQYVPAAIEWALYRCLSRDSEDVENATAARSHLQNFYALLGAKAPAELSASPKMRTYKKEEVRSTNG